MSQLFARVACNGTSSHASRRSINAFRKPRFDCGRRLFRNRLARVASLCALLSRWSISLPCSALTQKARNKCDPWRVDMAPITADSHRKSIRAACAFAALHESESGRSRHLVRRSDMSEVEAIAEVAGRARNDVDGRVEERRGSLGHLATLSRTRLHAFAFACDAICSF